MAKIGKLFHLTHLVTDLDAADRWYDKVFSAQRYYRGYMKAALRDASLVCVGDLVLEPIQVAKVPGAEKSPVGEVLCSFWPAIPFHRMVCGPGRRDSLHP